MWKTVENSSSVKPDAIDTTSSQAVVYVRKDFEEVPNVDEEGNPVKVLASTADPIHKCFGVSSLLIFHILGRIFEKITRTTMAIINAICVTESK